MRKILLLAALLWPTADGWAVPQNSPSAKAPSDAPSDLNKPVLSLPAAPQAGSQPAGVEPSAQEWNAEDWDVQKPQLNLLELSGYFRLRPDLIVNGNLGNNVPGILPHVSSDPKVLSTWPTIGNTQAGANMRARINPTLNITEDIQLLSTIDLFDNIVLGSTPSTIGANGPVLNLLQVGQNSPTANWNALQNSIALKRLYAKVMIGRLGELRFGRMPNKWGLGILANDGDCLDCDYGQSVDRIAFVAMLGSFYLVPMLDWISEGPTTASRAEYAGQPRDLSQLDDAIQYSLQFARKDSPEDIRAMLERGQVVVNYGLWNMFRTQARESPRYYIDPLNNDGKPYELETRSAFAYVVDGWGKLQWRKLTLELEGVFQYAQFKLASTDGTVTGAEWTRARQFGAALDTRVDILPELYVRLRAGIASGDPASTGGFGFGAEALNKRNRIVNSAPDLTIDNFQFNRDYRVDLLLFRELIGTVTGAWYVKPEVSYTFSNGLGGRFAPMYAQALYGSSTPGGQRPLGIELDFEALFSPKQKRGFEASLQYGLFIPLGEAFKNAAQPVGAQDPQIAHRILARAAVVF